MHSVVGPGVRIPAPVHPVVHPVKALALFGCQGLQLDVAKHCRAAADRFAQIFMAERRGVGLFQVGGIRQKAFAQPGGRQVAVGGVVHQLAGALFQRITVGPAAPRCRRVEAFECQGKAAAAEHALLHTAHLLGAVELVQLLEPGQADGSKWHLDAFQLAGVVGAKKEDLLPCGQISTLHGADGAAELLCQPQRPNGPLDLRIHTGAQRAADLAQHHRMAGGVAQQLQNKLNGNIAGFAAAAPALGHQFLNCAAGNGAVHRPEHRRYHIPDAHPHGVTSCSVGASSTITTGSSAAAPSPRPRYL